MGSLMSALIQTNTTTDADFAWQPSIASGGGLIISYQTVLMIIPQDETRFSMSADANALFQPFTLGDLTLPNRLVMAPLTRNRAAEGDVARDITATYYAQRAGAGLLI